MNEDSQDALARRLIEYNKATRRPWRDSLTSEQVTALEAAAKGFLRPRMTFDGKPLSAEAWCAWVASFEVKMRPRGLSIVREPGAPFTVEFLWHYEGPILKVHEVRITGDISAMSAGPEAAVFAPAAIDFDAYLHALWIRVMDWDSGDWLRRVPRKRPEPGRPLNTEFYRRLLDQHKHLLKEGHPAPVTELASRMKEKPATVRSWLHRANRYLAERQETV